MFTSEELLPQPFAWVTIPAGNVTLITEDNWDDNYVPKGKGGTTFTVPEFQIAKYPSTNAQFRKFIEAGGYKTDKWWTQAGLAQRNTDKWTQPRYWDDAKWNAADQPVVGVSWYEAVAFCLWLSETTGEKIMLPSEQGWQRAAKGDKGLIYPWGNDWNGNLCNNNVDRKGIGKTTPVRQYEGKGNSPFGVVDMAGNVWEWCSTAYETGVEDLQGTDVRALRGGSWGVTNTGLFRAVSRLGNIPDFRYYFWGFRFARF